MPQRSNLFQRLALLVHEALEPDWEVTESMMLADLTTGTKREVDIVATRRVATHQIYLSIECRDHNRAADVSWVEQMAMKHAHLPTSKLVLWSRSGFTNEALAKAKILKMETVTQARATSPTWARLAKDLVGGYVDHVQPTYEPFVDVRLPEGVLKRYEPALDWIFYNSSGTVASTMEAFVHQVATNKQTGPMLLDNAPQGEGDFWVDIIPPETWFADTGDFGRCAIARIGIGIKTHRTRTPLETATASVENQVMTLASAAIAGGTLEFFAQESEQGEAKVKIQLRRGEA